MPLFFYIKNNQNICKPDVRSEQILSREVSARFIEDLKAYGLLKRAYDYYLPSKLQLSIRRVNGWFVFNLPVFPLMMLTPLLNPYRTYQFFFARNH